MHEPPEGVLFLAIAREYLGRAEHHFALRAENDIFQRELRAALARIAEHGKDPQAQGEHTQSFETLPCFLRYEIVARPPAALMAELDDPHPRAEAGPDPRGAVVSAVFFPLTLPAEASPLETPAGVPRRFGMGVMLAFTLASAGLFALLRLLRVSALTIALVAFFFVFVGVGQAMLFEGKRPRLASMVVGILYFFLVTNLILVLEDYAAYSRNTLMYTLLMSVPYGAVAGYLCGGLLAGMFLRLRPQEEKEGNAESRRG